MRTKGFCSALLRCGLTRDAGPETTHSVVARRRPRLLGRAWVLHRRSTLRRNKVDRGKARVCHFGPYREYRENEAAPNKILWYAI